MAEVKPIDTADEAVCSYRIMSHSKSALERRIWQYYCFSLFFIALWMGGCVSNSGRTRSFPVQLNDARDLANLHKPHEAHRVLERLVGDWNVNIRDNVSEGEVSQTSQGFAQIRMVFGGRYVVEEFKGILGTSSYNGKNTIGFNNATGRYEASWIDSRNTAMLNSKGYFDNASDTFVFVGSIYNPLTKKMERVRSKLVFKDPDVFVMFIKSSSKSRVHGVTMQLVYSRR